MSRLPSNLFARATQPAAFAAAPSVQEDPLADLVRLDEIDPDPVTQVREGTSEEAIERYTELYSQGAKLPSLLLRRTPEGRLLIGDGHHRYKSAWRAGLLEVRARIQPGTIADALLDGLRGNRAHGLQLSGRDRAWAARKLLLDAHTMSWSHGLIAKEVGLSRPRISQIAADLTGKGLLEQPAVRVGVHGRQINAGAVAAAQLARAAPPESGAFPEEALLEEEGPLDASSAELPSAANGDDRSATIPTLRHALPAGELPETKRRPQPAVSGAHAPRLKFDWPALGRAWAQKNGAVLKDPDKVRRLLAAKYRILLAAVAWGAQVAGGLPMAQKARDLALHQLCQGAGRGHDGSED